MDPIQKRRNPFDVVFEEQEKVEPVRNQTFQRQEPVTPVKQPAFQANKTSYQQKKNIQYVEVSSEREKYTSTMDTRLRKQIKIACVNKGILFAQYVEEACREKLEREGMM